MIHSTHEVVASKSVCYTGSYRARLAPVYAAQNSEVERATMAHSGQLV